ncbi:helix-turn-helix domain-containing protein [Lysobacter auxotrophicus]|uniref:Helix-turn-helix domain-containing protein n=1 Tax=Lysobacter auxotrophicus TaxID=2992573 RepID=A0ABM8DGJ1_9GAMM|nr:helix-turn-helix domain-containing protein [Lysobacter auxotrophicus]BDU17731.1 helix-turn-helix domain-containing protein [Lysobacter auxotrophicus]
MGRPMDRPISPDMDSQARWRLAGDGWSLRCPDGSVVPLTRTERVVLERLLLTPGQLVTREALADAFTDGDFDSHRLDSLVYRLRRKVADGCGVHLPLDAIHGEGYMLDAMR